MARDRAGRTYRVRQIPWHVTRDSLATLLVSACDGLGSVENIVIHSLGSSLVPYEIPRTKTATIVFKSLPGIFDTDETQWTVRLPDLQCSILIDVEFLGFTALNDVDTDLHMLELVSSAVTHQFLLTLHLK